MLMHYACRCLQGRRSFDTNVFVSVFVSFPNWRTIDRHIGAWTRKSLRERTPTSFYKFVNSVSCGARKWTDDAALSVEEAVEQARLPSIGSACEKPATIAAS